MRSSSDGAGRAFVGGWRRVFAAPALVAGGWMMTVALALPFAIALRDAIERHLGPSLMASAAAAGIESRWWIEFTAQASGLAATLTPHVVGFAAVLANLSGVADGVGVPRPLLAPLALYAVVWVFLVGGILDRYARGRRLGAHAFFGASGRFFFRLLRLTVLTWLGYGVVAALWWALMARAFPWLTRDLTAERTAFAWLVCLYAVGLVPLVLLNLTADYARVRAVVEDRRSMIGAFVAAARFVARHPGAVGALYLANTVVFLAVAGLYAIIVPGGRGGDWRLLAVLAAGQTYLVARVMTRLAFLATAVVLFQSRLAHVDYTRSPVAVWPDSPAAEGIENAARYGGSSDI